MRSNPSPFTAITTVLMDVDGVLTDNFVLATEAGELLRRMHIKDGFAIQHALKVGLRIGVISGGRSLGVRTRLEQLGLAEIHLGASEKLPVYQSICQRLGLNNAEICYIGDDLPDCTVLNRAGLAVAPRDAAEDVLPYVHRVTDKPGGHGCVREVLETLLKAQGRWFTPQLHHW